jgi:hypothetical protein
MGCSCRTFREEPLPRTTFREEPLRRPMCFPPKPVHEGSRDPAPGWAGVSFGE